MPGDNEQPLKITLEDLAKVEIAEERPVTAPAVTAEGQRSYGTIADAADRAPDIAEEQGSILLQGWFYLGLAGLLGAVAGWGLCEPRFTDGEGHRWGNTWMLPAIVTLMCLGFGIAESIVERSSRKALIRGGLSLPLGIVLGFVMDFIANVIFTIGISICVDAGVQSFRNPAFWIARGIAWAVFGAAGGIVYGIVGQSLKKAKYGILGGMIGAGIGGVIFDPIVMLTKGGAPSRVAGFALVGLATGIAIGFVESALKDRWLYVTAGPLAGKQFILYKPQTTIGSQQQSDIYLFKDTSILAQHAVIGISGSRVQLQAMGPVYAAGVPVRQRVLQDGDLLQIGRYAFRYKERQRS
ncbi:MAG TPA: FHA domain-containing protein [Candidatus Angelobacter sp.]